ncbi:SUKH-3 domain-containing protein [Caballeronia sp. LZ034LL]|uniref:SUKH-3 domain-containing protein n=1 Tax=Caballeronia sp. LZ034LL TaxID=3038567 RepID=UPI0028609732|nr:SUKH-3 domain-containing protein [Caballeronia sp. LZ034LL]MDR5837787.1 SUKH-3 domain-containing protein [Caballeronia sp. LZ034LL]
MSYHFNLQVEKLLRENGWHPNRKIDPDAYFATILKQSGYLYHDAARGFLKQFGHLKITHKAYSSEESDESVFNPLEPADWVDYKWVGELYEPLAIGRLCVVGYGFSEHMAFFLSESGALYGGYDNYFCLIGDSVESGLENLFFGHDFQQIS